MSSEWISAAEALKLVSSAGVFSAAKTICTRAFAGLIRARADHLFVDDKPHANADVPRRFWWAGGEAALTQNWPAGDFSTWIDSHQLQAFGVNFDRTGIEALIGPAAASRSIEAKPASAPVGGRPAAAWWDDLWVEMCRQLWTGDLQPERQADIESAMTQWASTQGHEPATSTIRARASKLWQALNRKDEN